MEKSLLTSFFKFKNNASKIVLMYILVCAPIFSFAISPESYSQTPSSSENTSSTIYVTSGIVIVGANEMHSVKEINLEKENLQADLSKTETLDSKIAISDIKKVEKKTVKIKKKITAKKVTSIFVNRASEDSKILVQFSKLKKLATISNNFNSKTFASVSEFKTISISHFVKVELFSSIVVGFFQNYHSTSSLKAPPAFS